MNRLLLLAIKSGSALAVQAVVNKSFDPDSTDKFGRTALHLAANAGSLKICNLLVDLGCRPEVQDCDGLTCGEIASVAGHNELAMALQAIASPHATSPEVTSPVVQVVSESLKTQADWEAPTEEVELDSPVEMKQVQWGNAEIDCIVSEMEDWEVDENAIKPKDTGVSVEIWKRSRELLQPKVIHEFDATWDDVKFELSNVEQSVKGAKTAVCWPKAFRESISEWLSSSWADTAEIEQQKVHFRERDWLQIRQALMLALNGEAVSIISGEYDPWTNALAASEAVLRRGEPICDEDFLEFLHPAENADEWWGKTVSQLPFLSRFNEEALLNKLSRSRVEIVHSLSLSSPAMRIILKHLDDIFSGEEEFSTFSDADLDLVGEKEIEQTADVAETDIPSISEPQVWLSLLCPNGTSAAHDYMVAIDRLSEKFRIDETPILDGADLQKIAGDISILKLSPSYLRRLAEELSQNCGESTLTLEIEGRLNESEASRKKLIVSHLPHALAIAKKFEGRGLALEDLSQIAAQGVMRTLETFDPERGNRFWTLAQFWVRQSIARAIDNQARTVRIPVHALNRIRLISKARENLSKGNNELVDDAQIAEETGLEISAVANTKEYLLKRLGEEDYPHTDDSENAAESKISAYELKHLIEDHLQFLPEREQDIIARRFGLRGLEEETLEQIGQKYDVTRERIRQLEAKALRRLRHPSRGKELRELLNNV